MVSWESDGGVSGFNAGTAMPAEVRYLLASNAVVDVEGVTRLQYRISNDSLMTPDSTIEVTDRITALAYINFNQTNIDENPGRRMALTMFVASADDFAPGVIPTAAKILALGSKLRVNRSTATYDKAGTRYLFINGPRAQYLQSNTKYWVLVVPTIVKAGQPASTANDVPFSLGLARGLSMWTNRSPQAPIITSPPSGITAAAGTILTFSYASVDADRISGDSATYYADLAGVHVQYAARPSADDPTPDWMDMDITSSAGNRADPARYLRGSSTDFYVGAAYLRVDGTMPLACGSNTLVPRAGILPSGSWQIRMRTFDFGHPYPLLIRPFAKPDGNFSVTNAPAENTSPWSEPVYVSVSTQVPPPVPLSPNNSNAIPLGASVTLTWQYRNTFVPPFTQKARTVEIRKVGEAEWTTLVSGNGTASSYTITSAYPLEATTHYEWRVQVTDMDDEVSNFSSTARFWIVPEPASGVTRPVPLDTIDGASLGCGTHRAFVYRRGGTTRVGEIHGISHLDWNRVRDDISDAKIIINDWDIDGGTLLGRLQTWAYEIVIFRDNGYSVDRVWEGPITRLTYERDSVTIHAQDMMVYAYRRIVKQAMNDSGKGNGRTVTARATSILLNAFAPDDPNVLAYLQVLSRPDDAMQYRSLPPFSRTAFEEIDDMAANAGLDYTVVGRAILLWGTRHRIGTLPEFRDDDLGSTPIVSEYGMAFANFYSVSDGNGVHGDANRLDADGKDRTYGLVEMLSSSWASDSDAESGTYTEAGLATVIKSFEGFAEKSIADRFPPPVIVRVPDNTTLNPDVAVSIQQFVPGVLIPLRSNGTLRSVVTSQKLDSVTVTEESGNETITIVMSPFSSDDTEVVV